MRPHVFPIAACVSLALSSSASAAVINPNTTVDQFNSDAALCSLREAVWAADNDSSAMSPGCTAGESGLDTIQLAPGRYELQIPNADPGETDVTVGDLDHFQDLSIQALAGGPVVIDANGTDRIFQTLGADLTIDGVTLTGGRAVDPDVSGSLSGGAIAASSGTSMVLTDSALIGNQTDGSGGAIASFDSVMLTNVTVSGNSSDAEGGGIGMGTVAGALTLESSTITANTAEADGSTGSGGGGVGMSGGAGTVTHNSIIAGNGENNPGVDAPDCVGNVVSSGGNVIGSTAGCTTTPLFTDAVGPAGLSGLGFHGGPTETHALLAGSAAIDRAVTSCPSTDQRGAPRPVAAEDCDSGAFELGPNHTLTVSASNGTVAGPGIACPPDCAESYLDGTNVPLGASPATGFLFIGWTGACSGTGSCVPIMDADRAVGASFASASSTAVPNPRCAKLRKKLKKAKKAGNRAKVRKLRRKLRRLGC